MRRVKDVSPAVRELAYSDDEKTLDVVWSSDAESEAPRRYRFFDVPVEVFNWLLEQKSKGGFIRRKIIGHYREERIDEARPPVTKDSELLERLESSLLAIGTTPPPHAADAHPKEADESE